MPRLPSFQDVGNVSPTIKRDPGVTAPVEAFQSTGGIAAQELAPSLKLIAGIAREEEKRKDQAKVNDSRRELLEFETERNEWLSQQKGENVFSAKAQLDKDIDTRLAQIRGGLKNDRQRIAFKEVEGDWRVGVNRSSSRYIAAEMDRYYDDSDNKLLEASSRAAQKSASLGEFDRVQQEWLDQEKVIAGFADRKGLDATQRQALLDGKKSNFHVNVAMQLIADNNDNEARAYLNSNRKEFDADDNLKIQGLLKKRLDERAGEYRIAIADKMQDIEAMAQRGIVPPKDFISDSEIDVAYSNNAERAAQTKRRRDEGYRFAFKTVTIHNENNDQLIAELNKPFTPGDDPRNFAEQARHDDMLKLMRANVLKQRLMTPMEYAEQQKIGDVNEIDFSDINSIGKETENRQHVAKLMQDRHGSPIKLLKAQEAAKFSRATAQMTPGQKRQLFKTFADVLGDDMTSYRSLMAQIAPDDPVTAMAGISANRKEANQQGQFVADLMLRGQALLHPPKKSDGDPDKGTLIPMPSEKEMREEFDSEVRDAFVGMDDTVRGQYYQATRAVYAALSMDAGDKDTQDLNSDRFEESIKLATGGIEKYNGKRTIMPFGMERSQFKQEMRGHILALKDRLPENLTTGKLENMPVTPFGDGRYVFMIGNSVLGDKDGQRLVVDLNQKLPPPPADVAKHSKMAEAARRQREAILSRFPLPE